ncbi:FAD-binding oxidoreductase [Candidatus Pelagibacter sp.]|nr:FAD-binding oxidoreductase [Candidatus Pelagibacter sp.]
MNIAIIGSGFFGSTLALILSKKHQVTLFEKKTDILQGASKVNQFRFHRGYHYPRSTKTIDEIKESYYEFIKFYGKDVFTKTENYYAIPKKGSKISFNRYLKILKKNKLPYRKINGDNLVSDDISGTILSNEKIINYFKIKKKIKNLINKSKNLKLVLKAKLNKKLLDKFDKVFIVTYQNNNEILKNLNLSLKKKYKFELIEKIVVKIDKKYRRKSFVVADGKFVCLDPYLGTNYHLLSDVAYSKLEINEGFFPRFKNFKKNLVNKNSLKSKKKSQFSNFITHGSKYLPFLKNAKFIKSFFIIRTLKRNVEKTDERTSEFMVINNKYHTILSSKWNTCVSLAKKIEKKLKL